jgi:hypothetical protein
MRKLLVLLAVVGLVSAVGCGKKDGEDKAGAEKKEGAESAAAANTIEGKWGIDLDSMIASNPDMKKQIEANPAAKGMMEAAIGAMSFEFGKDSMTVNMGSEAEKATYKVVSSEGNTMVIESSEEGKDKVEKFTATFETADKVTLSKEGEPTKFTLVRKK